MDRIVGFVKIFNVVAGILLIGGVVALVWLLVQRKGDKPVADVPAATRLAPDTRASLALPDGARIASMTASGGAVWLLVEEADGAQFLLQLDPEEPARSARIDVAPAAP